jgi:hypothetical protein
MGWTLSVRAGEKMDEMSCARERFPQPDHYIYRMLYGPGISLEALEIGQLEPKDARRVWRIFVRNYYLFGGTPTRLWLDFAFQELFGLDERLSESDSRCVVRHDLGGTSRARVPAAGFLRAF